jgi:CheY-like chemotaxis protein
MTNDTHPIVMVVEDDQDIREALVEMLEENEYRPIGVANGREAIDVLRAVPDKPCLILLDLMMPVMDGREFRELQLKDAKLGAIPVVVLSAHADLKSATEGMEAQVALKKPVAIDSLLEVVQRYCAQPGASVSK